MQKIREIIFDTETTGLSARDGDRIIEIGAIEMINKVATGQTFHEYLDPGDRQVHPDAEAIHGISNAQLAGKPSFEDLFEKFSDFFDTGTLIAHNASFDMGFLNAELKRIGKPGIDPSRVLDTLQIARKKFPAGPNSLDALCNRFGISNAHRTLHGALLDSELLSDVYIELTGGRQTGFDLSSSQSGSTKTYTGQSAEQSPQKSRPKPLPLRLTEDEMAAHAVMIAKMGDKAVWKKWRP